MPLRRVRAALPPEVLAVLFRLLALRLERLLVWSRLLGEATLEGSDGMVLPPAGHVLAPLVA